MKSFTSSESIGFGRQAIIRSKAPLRLGLAGGGTDVSPYCDEFGGCVLNVTINMYAYCTIEPTNDGRIEFIAKDRNESFSFESSPYIEPSGILPLHKGMYNRIMHDFCKGQNLSFRMTTYSDAPAGSGLGSSSTMIVAILKAYMEWLNLPLGEYEMAHLAYDVERKDVGLSGGKQDQYAATFGGLNFIEFTANDQVIVNPLRIKKWIRNELENMLILYYTGTSRDSATIINEQIKNIKDKNSLSIEGMHELKASAYEMKRAILQGDFNGVIHCLNQGWEAKKKTSSVVSNPAIENIYNFIISNGGRAAKISGAGGGGFMIILCDPKERYSLVEKLKKTDGRVMLTSFIETGTQSWTLYQ